MKKVILLNASPRKNFNTAKLLREAEKGAQAAGAETEYIDLNSLTFKGCLSCLACKRKDAARCKCFWHDDLSPVIDGVLQADAVILGTPIYFSEPTALFRGFLERLLFCCLSYDGGTTYFQGKLPVGIIYDMNAPQEYYESTYKEKFKEIESLFTMVLHSDVSAVASCGTIQVADYTKYAMSLLDGKERLELGKKQFPEDLKAAFELGGKLGQ